MKRCLHCNAVISGEKPSALAKRKFCSTSCHYRYKLERRSERWRCVMCGQPTRHAWSTRCRRCSHLARPRLPCTHCGSPIPPWRRYCSVACYGAHKRRRVLTKCAQCDKAIERFPAQMLRNKRHFCSARDQDLFQRGENHPYFKGSTDQPRGTGWRLIASKIRDRDGHMCRRCGVLETDNGRRLSIDHIIPLREFNGDLLRANSHENLISLCALCHGLKTTAEKRRWHKGDSDLYNAFVDSLPVTTTC